MGNTLCTAVGVKIGEMSLQKTLVLEVFLNNGLKTLTRENILYTVTCLHEVTVL